MDSNKFSLGAMGVPDRLISGSATWHHIFGWQSFWLWFWLLLSLSLTSAAILLFRKCRKAEPAHDSWESWLEKDDSIRSTEDSPFLAYLGHNILTEGRASNPTNTSTDAINRLPEHLKLRNTRLTDIFEEPKESNQDDTHLFSPSPRYRSYTYPDTRNKQIRLDHVEQLHDPADDRRWQRRTMHIYSI